MLTKRTVKYFFIFVTVFLLFTMLFVTDCVTFADGNPPISNRADFLNALQSAEEGDVLYVGDIDFNLEGTGAVNVAERITISKSITIKSGKANNEKALFVGASFDIKGTTVAGKRNSVSFVGITFDERLDTATLTNTDWELSYDSLGTPIAPQPLKSQYAVRFFGNLVASFENCNFQNYMYTYGAAMGAYYNSDSVEYADNKNCSLDLLLTGSNFTSNVALYGGGAIYLQSNNKNVSLRAVSCVFYQNKSGFVQYASGGGAIYTHGANVELVACDFSKNVANYYYGGEKPTNDTICGGAVYCNGDNVSYGCSLVMRGCSVKENTASNGGGIAVAVMSNVVIDNNYIAGNSAKPSCEDTRNVWGLSSNQGQGGGIYFDGTRGDVTIINSDVVDNYAETIFPAICHETSADEGLLNVDIVLCTIANNLCATQMSEYKYADNPAWIWFTYPGDIYELAHIKVVGCIVIDEDFGENFPRYEMPTESNGYNYFATHDKALIDGYESEDSHRSVVATQIVPKTIYGEYFDKLNITPVGDFHIGSNHKATVKIVLKEKDTVTQQFDYVYGVPTELPAMEKKWHSFDGWFAEDGMQISTVNFVFAHNIDAFLLTARYTDVFPYQNVVGGSATLNEDGSVTLTADTAPKGQVFKEWQINGRSVSEESTYSLDFAENMTAIAVFESKGPSAGVIVGIVLAFVALCVAISFAMYFVTRRKKLATATISSTQRVTAKEQVCPDTSSLTERENQVLELLLQGKKRAEIAATLFVSEETIKKQITSIYGKLGVTSRSELFAKFK